MAVVGWAIAVVAVVTTSVSFTAEWAVFWTDGDV